MRKYRFLLTASLLAFALIFHSCRGPEGLPGPQGPQGPAGDELLPAVFHVTADFTSNGNYRTSYTFPANLGVLQEDVVLVYLLYDMANVNGSNVPVWRALPQIFPTENGFFQYNFDYTQYDVEFFMDGNIDLATLDQSWRLGQEFRVAILPAVDVNARKSSVDFSNYEEVIKAYGIDESKIVTLKKK